MNIDIRLSLEFFDHPKVGKLERRLGLEAVVCLLKLWGWAAKNRPNGKLEGLDVEDVEFVARWKGSEGEFVATLLALRLLDEVDGGFAVHDWEEHQAYASKSEERSSKARKAAEARWNRTAEVPVNTDSDAQGMLNDAASNAKNMLSDATSMQGACYRQCPRNQEPGTRSQDIHTPPTQDDLNNLNTRARALNLAWGEGGGAEPAASAVPGETGGAGELAGEGVHLSGPSGPDGPSGLSRLGPARTDAPGKGTPEWTAFLSCWDVYPVRQGQEEAWREWMRLKRNGTLEAAFVIREAIMAMREQDSRWLRGKVPKFARWLNGKGWNDTPYVEPGDLDAGRDGRDGPALSGGGRGKEPVAPTEYQRQRQSSRRMAAALLAGRREDGVMGGGTETGTGTDTGGVYETTAFATAGGALPAVRTGSLA